MGKKTMHEALTCNEFLRSEMGVRDKHVKLAGKLLEELTRDYEKGVLHTDIILHTYWSGNELDAILNSESTRKEMKREIFRQLAEYWRATWPHLTIEARPKVIPGVKATLPVDRLRGSFGSIAYRQVFRTSSKLRHAKRQARLASTRALSTAEAPEGDSSGDGDKPAGCEHESPKS